MNASLLKIGCCGFPLPKPEYARRFPVVEVQQTFYQPPQISTLQRWRALVPSSFEFTLKAWQLITHLARSPTYRRLKVKLTPQELEQCGSFQRSPVTLRAWATTVACAQALAARYVLFQCPASFIATTENVARMRHFFASIERHHLQLLWEPRGPWAMDLIGSLCQELNLIHAVDPFVSASATPDFVYFRLHGGKDFKHNFTAADNLRMARLIPPGVPAYVLFNNINMLNDAEKFQSESFE